MNNRIITPVGTASWPYLHEPNTRWDDNPENQKYECGVVLEKKEAAALEKQLKAFAKAEFEKELAKRDLPKDKRKLREAARIMPWKPERDEEDELTGNTVFTSKSKSKPLVVDPAGNPISVKVGSGSQVRLSIVPRFWAVADKCGVSLMLNAVQVMELVEWGSLSTPKTAEEAGFDTAGEAFEVSDETDEDDDAWDNTEESGDGEVSEDDDYPDF